MTDLNETLAGMRTRSTASNGSINGDVNALLSAVQNVLALCDEFDNPALTNKFGPWVPIAAVRKALTDALGAIEQVCTCASGRHDSSNPHCALGRTEVGDTEPDSVEVCADCSERVRML